MTSYADILEQAQDITIEQIDRKFDDHGFDERPEYVDDLITVIDHELEKVRITPVWLMEMLTMHPDFLETDLVDVDVQGQLKSMLSYFIAVKTGDVVEPYIDVKMNHASTPVPGR